VYWLTRFFAVIASDSEAIQTQASAPSLSLDRVALLAMTIQATRLECSPL
jgi:hypothetical protein